MTGEADADSAALAILTGVQDRWNAAMASWDADAVSALYHRDAQMFGSLPDLFRGVAGVRRYFASFEADGVIATFDNRAVRRLDAGMIVASGYVAFRVTAADKPSLLSYRFSFVLRREDGEWLILLHHASPVPETAPSYSPLRA